MEKKKHTIKISTKRNVTTSRIAWLVASRALADRIRKNPPDQIIDVDRIIELDRQDFENRFSYRLDE